MILAILLAIALGLASIIVGGAKIAESMGNSVKAFHAADTGIEKALYNIKSGDCDGANASGTFATGYSYTVVISYTGGSCFETGTSIESLGEYNTTKRKVEASY